MCISVLLPEPDGPMIATISPALDRDVDAAERLDDVSLAEAVGLAEVASFEEWPSVGLPLACGWLFIAEGGDRVEPGRVEGGDEAGERAEDRRRRGWR